MQDEVNEKIIALCISGGRITARILKESIEKALIEIEQSNRKETIEKSHERKQTRHRGKQSMASLTKQGSQLSNIEITDGNIRSFGKCARKYNVDYSLKKDTSTEPPRYFVFFKAKDVDVITAAFKEYSGRVLLKSKKPSIRKKLELAKERAARHREREKKRQKDRGQEH